MTLQLESAADVDRLEEDARWKLMERILITGAFKRSPRLAEFLRYVTRMTLLENDGALSEQRVGEAVFGRPADYDSSADTVVRSSALRLRRQLELYFQREGSFEAVALTLPRGGYRVAFDPRLRTEQERPENDPLAPVVAPLRAINALPTTVLPGSTTRRLNPVVMAIIAGLCVALLVESALLFRRSVSSRRATGSSSLLWPMLFTANHPTRIILGDSGLVLFHAVTHRYLSLSEYVAHRYDLPEGTEATANPDFARFLAERRYTSVVDAGALLRLSRLPEATPDRTLVQFARDVRLEDLKEGNIILLGAQEANPWVELFEHSMDFQFQGPRKGRDAAFVDRHPKPGYPQEYSTSGDRIFAVVAFLPNVNNSSNVLLLEGLNMTGTESAIDFVLEKDKIEPFLAKLRKPDGSLSYFEILLECRTVTDNATPATIVEVRRHSL
jgi:hypothetical protein